MKLQVIGNIVSEDLKEEITLSGIQNIDEKEFFQEAGKTKKGGRPRKNYLLTRYVCYLIALNSDARFLEVSLAKTYFASQTRKS